MNMNNDITRAVYRFMCELVDEYMESVSGEKKDCLLEFRDFVQHRWEVIDARKKPGTSKGRR